MGATSTSSGKFIAPILEADPEAEVEMRSWSKLNKIVRLRSSTARRVEEESFSRKRHHEEVGVAPDEPVTVVEGKVKESPCASTSA